MIFQNGVCKMCAEELGKNHQILQKLWENEENLAIFCDINGRF